MTFFPKWTKNGEALRAWERWSALGGGGFTGRESGLYMAAPSSRLHSEDTGDVVLFTGTLSAGDRSPG